LKEQPAAGFCFLVLAARASALVGIFCFGGVPPPAAKLAAAFTAGLLDVTPLKPIKVFFTLSRKLGFAVFFDTTETFLLGVAFGPDIRN
jgi:hypothetical protein